MNEKRSVIPTVCLAYATLLVAALIVLRSPYALPVGSETSMSRPRAVFLVINAGTLTGFQTTLSMESFRWPAQWAFLILTITGATLSWIVGGIFIARALLLDISEMQIVGTSALLIVIAVFAGGATAQPLELFDSVMRSTSALANSGVWIGHAPGAADPGLLGLYLPLAVIGGLGATVLIELVRLPVRRTLSRHASAVLTLTAAAYLIGMVLFLWTQWMSGAVTESTFKSQFVLASDFAINARTAGIPIVWLNASGRGSQWVTATLMALGAAPGGAAGGIGLTTMGVLGAAVVNLLRGRPVARIAAVAAVWIATYLLLVFGTFLGMLSCVPEMSADRLLMVAISAVSNAGLSHDVISLSQEAYWLLSASMLLGRLAPLLALWWAATLAEREGRFSAAVNV